MSWLTLIGEGLSLLRVLTDPTKRREAYELLLDKRAKKALEIAEETYFLVDDHLNKKISTYKFKLRYKYLRKHFFKYN